MRWTCKDCNRVVDQLSATPYCPHCRAEQTFNIYAGGGPKNHRKWIVMVLLAAFLIYFLR
jgi:hypothetical protein